LCCPMLGCCVGKGLDFVPRIYSYRPALLIRGRHLEASTWRSGVRRPRVWFAARHSGGPGLRPGTTTGALRGARCIGRYSRTRRMRVQEARTGADGGTHESTRLQMPRWSAERRAPGRIPGRPRRKVRTFRAPLGAPSPRAWPEGRKVSRRPGAASNPGR
jgi:hypothetical protein